MNDAKLSELRDRLMQAAHGDSKVLHDVLLEIIQELQNFKFEYDCDQRQIYRKMDK